MKLRSFLVLDDATVFKGYSFGAEPLPALALADATDVKFKGAGELVFNTAMTGYHEVLTDPSYTGQIVLMTYPHMGNYGDSDPWSEIGPERVGLSGVKPAGLVVRKLYSGPVPDDRESLHDFLKKHDTPGITDVDTRAITLKTRDEGARSCVIVSAADGRSLSKAELDACMSYLKGFPKMEGRSLVSEVGSDTSVVAAEGSGGPHIALLDCGSKANIIRELSALGCKVTLLPAAATAEEVRSTGADAVLVSNGPGDPATLETNVGMIQTLVGQMPVLGICLGHQLIAQAIGASTYKMKFGHHGVNHPVRDELTKRVFVTSQNHGFSVHEDSLPSGCQVWFRNANDKTIEGLVDDSRGIRTTQFHPESAPGPADSRWIFEAFLETVGSAGAKH